MKRMLLLEFNELSPVLMAQFIEEGHLPNFKRLRGNSKLYQTTSSDDELQPWVQWVTFHVGQPQVDHKIFSLDEGHLVQAAPIWDTLCEMGHSSLVFGAMNGITAKQEGVDLMPDSWASKVRPTNNFLSKVHRFSQSVVQEHANPTKNLTNGDLVRYMLFFLRHGMGLATVFGLMKQLAMEKLSGQDIKWRRACYFDQIMWDIFLGTWRRSDKEVGVFFGNSTAHLQHRYWRHMDSSDFQHKPSEAQRLAYSDAIRYGYIQMDRMVGQILDNRSFENTTVVLATALSQEANPTRKETRPHEAYRPLDFDKFLAWAGVEGVLSVEPLMTHLAWASFADPAARARAEQQLQGVTVDGEPVISIEAHGHRVKLCCSITHLESQEATLRNNAGEQMRFVDMFALVGSSILDGSHHPDGILWISRTRATSTERSTETTSIALENAKQLLLTACQR